LAASAALRNGTNINTLQTTNESAGRIMTANAMPRCLMTRETTDNWMMRPHRIRQRTFGQQNLWGFGISRDLPIVLLRIAQVTSLPLARQVLDAQEYWRVKGLRADVVILNEHPTDYLTLDGR
jgi:cellobiose phosphorylase